MKYLVDDGKGGRGWIDVLGLAEIERQPPQKIGPMKKSKEETKRNEDATRLVEAE